METLNENTIDHRCDNRVESLAMCKRLSLWVWHDVDLCKREVRTVTVVVVWGVILVS